MVVGYRLSVFGQVFDVSTVSFNRRDILDVPRGQRTVEQSKTS